MKAMTIFAAALALLAGCRDTSKLPDPRIEHPLTASPKTFSLAMPAMEPGKTLDSSDRLRLRTFARDYLRRGRSPLEIMRPGEEGEVVDGVSALQRELEAEGIGRELMVVTPVDASDKTMLVLSYRGYEANLPDCPDWSSQSSFNPSNYPHSNFGCAVHRNIGIMLSDPGDLAAPRVLDRMPGQESDRVIGLFRKGEPTPAKSPEGAKGTVSSVGQK